MGIRSARTQSGSDADEDKNARAWAALQSLPARLRKVLLLREVEGLPMDEVAARLGLSRRAVERRWMRAIVLASERLEKLDRQASGADGAKASQGRINFAPPAVPR